jgi:hypothetical protein
MIRKYRPANGTEGMEFMAKFCDRCQVEVDSGLNGCDIRIETMIYETDVSEYPSEFIINDEGQAECLGFKPIPPPDYDNPNQGKLFTEATCASQKK